MPPHIREIGTAEFADEEGRPLRARLEAYSGIWVPPKTELAVTGDGKFTVVCYPVPESLNEGVENRRIRGQEDLWISLQESGWKHRKLSDADTLVEDFLALSYSTDARDVKYFSKKYGPLWFCSRHHHLWNPMSPSNVDRSNPDTNAYCLWVPREFVEMFQTHAKYLKACLAIANCLTDSRPEKPSLQDWQLLFGQHRGKYVSGLGFREQRDEIGSVMGGAILQFVSPWLTWDRGPRPELSLQTGLGFIGRVWLQAAQLVAGGVELRTCSGCQSFYVRRERKPPKGWNNFCDECRATEGKRISKRLWAKKTRQAQQESELNSSRTKRFKRKG